MNRTILTAASALGLAALAVAAPPAPVPSDPQMRAVLDQLAALKPKPIDKLTPREARQQPTPATAVKALLKKQGRTPAPERLGRVYDTRLPSPTGTVRARVYVPYGVPATNNPVIVYLHGGGWVIATNETYDASARALCSLTKAVVVSVEYRKAPEYKFPAAHEDAYAVTQHVLRNASTFLGDPNRVAIVGESAGGNMATAVCMMARDRGGKMPAYQALIYPVTDTRMNTPSYEENALARPLNRPMMRWFFKQALKTPKDADNPYLAVLRGNVRDLPPATIITARIDPLRSEGKAYADKLQAAGIAVRYRDFEGVAHEFFGMGAVLDQAKTAQQYVAEGLLEAFNRQSAPAPTSNP
jgi:acetyl esterase